jgi:ketosteroid isomerase-like protein
MTQTDDERAVRAVTDEITDALHGADAEKLDSLLSDLAGCTHIGTDPGEWWSKAKFLEEIGQAMGVGESLVRAEHGDIVVHVLGDVAWVEGTGKFVNDQGAERPIRTTGVFVRDGGAWKSAQSHASIGVANEDMFKL